MIFTPTAKDVCKKFSFLLDTKKIFLEPLSQTSEERKDNGIMIGVLICEDKNKNQKILFTVSGVTKKINFSNYVLPQNFFYVEPVASLEKINLALKKNDEEIHSLTKKINACNDENLKAEFKRQRTLLTDESLKNVFALYDFCTAQNNKINLLEICKTKFPPTGTGECCAPKLLHHCFKNNFTPLDMAEIFYCENENKNSAGKIKNQFYLPCKERCSLILPSILGLEILYYDDDIVVVNKPSGILSVPGRTLENQDCISSRIKRLFPNCINQPAVHRLDMETSGIMVYALTKNAHKNLSLQFESRTVQKEYVALLDGNLYKKKIPKSGAKDLFFRLDVENRPHQIWDDVNGKSAVTEWKILDVEKYNDRDVTRVLFIPHTGRTHQLRLISSDSHGFGVPIIGDSLYGKSDEGERLMLHAQCLKFIHPASGKQMEFFRESDF